MIPTRRTFTKGAGALAVVTAFPTVSACASSAEESVGAAGFWLPEESEPHERTFMQWPVSREVHPDRVFLRMLQQSIADVANAIVDFEPVIMLMGTEHERNARRLLSDAVEVWDVPTDDLWCRDSGPCFVRNDAGDLAIRHFNFNGWGGKQTHENDGRVAAAIAQRLDLPLLDNGLVGEPGGLEFDGVDTVMAHASSWVIHNRNVGSTADVEAKILEAVGADKMIWAPGLEGLDITDYHIDSLARFTEPGTVVIQLPEETDVAFDVFAAAAHETHQLLTEAVDAAGNSLEIVKLRHPYDVRVDSIDFVASYVNYYVCNGALISAQFGDAAADAEAEALLGELYPNREIVMLAVDPIGETGGGVHCATQQQPSV